MEIRKMVATFGALQNRQLDLQPGMNVLYAPNESGKSTWCQFLRVMLYGMQGRGENADKVRYTPWAGGTMSGSLEITSGGKSYTISRDTLKPSSPMGELTCTYTGTAIPCDEIAGQQPGEALLGIPQSIFERSAFVGEGALSVSQTAELEKRITALISAGDENISFSESYARLKKQLNQRRFNKSGDIPRLEGEIDTIQQEIASVNSLTAQRASVMKNRETRKKEVAVLTEKQRIWQIIIRQEEARYALRRQQQAKGRLEQLKAQADAAHAQHTAHPLYGKTDEALSALLDNTLPQPVPSQKWQLSILCSAALFLILTGVSLLTHHVALAILFGIVGLASAVGYLLFMNTRRSALLHNSQLGNKRNVLQSQIAERNLLAQSDANARAVYDQYAEFFANLPQVEQSEVEDVDPPAQSADEVAEQLEAKTADLQRLQSQWDTLCGRLEASPDVNSLNEILQEKNRHLQELQDEYDAIAMAMEVLDMANNDLQSRFSPKLGSKAAKIFSGITGGRYDQVFLSRELQIHVQARDDTTARNSEVLSQGTADQLYLAVRLAMCDMVLPPETSVPLILDDTFLCFDDERLTTALDYLLKESKHRQIVLFSCQRREADYLRGKKGVSIIEM